MHVRPFTRIELSTRAAAIGLMLASMLPLAAQLPGTRLTALFPAGGKVGTTVEVAAQGTDFDEPARLQFSHNGIKATAMDLSKFKVTIASNVPPGVYDARYIGRFGVSNPRRFVVGTLREDVVPPINTSETNAFELPINSTGNGRIAARSYAWYKFRAKKAQRVFIECLAESLDSRLDPSVAVLDGEGREWERSRTGDVLDFTAPTDGMYFIRLADFLYRGGDDYGYRLTVSTGPRVDYILPQAGVAGTKTNFTLFGRALPGGKPVKGVTLGGKPLEQLVVSITLPSQREERMASSLPASAALDTIEYRFKGANPVFLSLLRSNPGPILIEQEPNSKPAQAQAITPPCEISGRFHPAADIDRFVFSAKKGDVYWLEVISHRLGLPTAPQLLVQRLTKSANGEEKAVDVLELTDTEANLGDREFNTASRDPAGRFEASEDGTYRVELRDLFSPTSMDPRNTYHLSIRRPAPDFRLVAQTIAPKYKADQKNIGFGPPIIRRGESLPVRVLAFRRDGFNGDIELSLEQPPQGLSLLTDRIEGGKNADYVLLTASIDAPPFAGPLRLIGRAQVGDLAMTRTARGGALIFPVENVDNERPESRTAQSFELAVTDQESAPITIAPAENRPWEVAANGKLEVPLTITRRGEFNATLKLKPIGPGAADALKEFDVDAKATNATLKLDFAALKLAPGRHLFAVQNITTGKYRNNPEAAAFAEAKAKEADKLAGESAAAAKQAAAELEKLKKAVAEAETAAKAAGEKLALAKAAAEKAVPPKAPDATPGVTKTPEEKTPAEEKVKTELAAAQKTAEEAQATARNATQAASAAEKTKTDAEARAKESQARKEEAAKRAKDATDKAKPRDVSYQVTSAPIVVQVTPAPPPAPAKDGKEKKQAGK